ncbi:hypothetical protein SAMN05216354_0332 [Xylanibacter ruminicola]|uniref:Uncharacterized protein n=1 Tax=Xylanibacter ruminicola TaxID=839 RepID=A0A1H5RTX0_XYLRU|nr:hypothetical protein SAMN05216354_0332 [Xylanibacter ruminicola]
MQRYKNNLKLQTFTCNFSLKHLHFENFRRTFAPAKMNE